MKQSDLVSQWIYFCMSIVALCVSQAAFAIGFETDPGMARFEVTSANKPIIAKGATGVQTVTITNKGPNAATGTQVTVNQSNSTGVSITSVTWGASNTVCPLSGVSYTCNVGSIANNANFNIKINYAIATSAPSGTEVKQTEIIIKSNEFNPGSGSGEILHKVWGALNQEDPATRYGAFWPGRTSTDSTCNARGTTCGTYAPENSLVLGAWPKDANIPVGEYLDIAFANPANAGGNDRYFVNGASLATGNKPTINRVVANIQSYQYRQVLLPSKFNAGNTVNNRRAWEFRTYLYIPPRKSTAKVCIGDASYKVDDNAYMTLTPAGNSARNVVGAPRDAYQDNVYETSAAINEGYYELNYRIVNQNGNNSDEESQGGYGEIGLAFDDENCNVTNLQKALNAGFPTVITITDPASDLIVSKTNGTSSVINGASTTYTVRVTNNGPDPITGSILRDPAVSGLTPTAPSCSATVNNKCTVSTTPTITQLQSAGGYALPVLASGDFFELNIPATVSTSLATISNQATITAPAGTTDTDTANNTATDTDSIRPRIRIAKISNNGVGTFSFTGMTNLSDAAGTAVTTDTVTTVTSGTAAQSTQNNYASSLSNAILISETVPANYTLTAASCVDNNRINTGNPASFGTRSNNQLTIALANVRAGADIVCTFTNDRKSANLTLRKIWSNAKLNDAVSISATGLTAFASTANTASENDSATAQTVYAGDSITLGETFTTGSASNYNSTLACTGNTTALAGSTLTVNPADTAITCTYTNSRIAQQFNLSKNWQNAVNGHTATATTTGGVNAASFISTSTGNNSTSGSAVTVYAGDVVNLPAETFGGGASAAQYNSTLACSGGTALASGAVARTITISNSTTATVCTYTNARRAATLTLSKIWSSGSIAGDTATVSSSGFGNNATSGTSTATAAGNTTTGTSVTVYAGETGTISETFGTGTASNYNATLACSGNSTALSGNTLTINPADTAISCSYTNTVAGTDLAIDKTGTSSVTQGNTVSYSIKVWNKGPGVASSSTFTDNVPGALTNVIWSCSASGSAVCGTASGSGNTISVTTGTLPVNASSTAPTTGSYLTFSVTGTAASVGNISNTASIAVTSGTDPVMANNSSSASTTVNAPTAITPDTPQKEARFTITPDLPTIYRGQAGTQLVTIKNEGPDDASGTVATFKPRTQTGVTVTSVKIAGGANCSFTAGAWSCPVGSVANGGSFQLEVGYDTTTSSTLGTAIQADIRVNSNEFNPGSGVGEILYRVWGSTNPNGNSQLNEIRPNGAFALGYGTANANENVNLSTAWTTTQINPTGAYLTQALIGSNNSVFGPVGTYEPMISRIITNLNSDPIVKTQTLLALTPANQAGDNRRAWELITGIYVPPNSNASLCIGSVGGQLDDSAYIMLNGAKVGTDGKYNSGSSYIQTSVPLLAGYNRVNYRIANRNTPGSNEDFAQGLYGEIGLSINGGACTAANLDSTARLQIPASINIIEKPQVTITGQVFEDNSGTTSISSNAYNGIKDAGELAIADSTVTINNCTSTTAIATTKTDANGEYTFNLLPTVLPVGNFCIAQKNLDGYSSVSGTTGYNRVTDQITVSNTGASSYANYNFGDARLNAILTEDGQQTIIAGGVADYPHRLTAQSVLTVTSINQTSTQQPANATDASWQMLLYRDLNCNGKVDAGENLMSASLPLSLKANEQVCLVQRVYAPATASMGAQHIGQLQASFAVTLADTTPITGSSIKRQDTTLLGSAGLSMQKRVRNVASCVSTPANDTGFSLQNEVQNGGYLEYEITYRNNSLKNLVDISVKDSVPSGTIFQNNMCYISPTGICTPSKTGDALLWQIGGTLLPNQQGKVRFCVQTQPLSVP